MAWQANVHDRLNPIQQKAWVVFVQEKEREKGL